MLAVILFVIAIHAVGWAVTSVLVWILSILFNFGFSLSLSTGIYIILMMAKWVFSSGKGKD